MLAVKIYEILAKVRTPFVLCTCSLFLVQVNCISSKMKLKSYLDSRTSADWALIIRGNKKHENVCGSYSYFIYDRNLRLQVRLTVWFSLKFNNAQSSWITKCVFCCQQSRMRAFKKWNNPWVLEDWIRSNQSCKVEI